MVQVQDKVKHASKIPQIALELKRAYEMELETVINYLANSVHLDGLLASEIKESLKKDISEELNHATLLANRLKVLESDVPGSLALKFDQKSLQPPAKSTDIASVIDGVIEAEDGAIKQYRKIIELTDGIDPVTNDLCIKLLEDEENHRREFIGFKKDLEARPALQ